MWATIIIAESFTRIMGSTTLLVMCSLQYHRRRRFLQYNFMDPGWGGEFLRGARPPPAGTGAVMLCIYIS